MKNEKKLKHLINEQNILIKLLFDKVSNLINNTPNYISIRQLKKEINKSNQTISYHLYKNFEPEVDFRKENGKIMIHRRIVPQIKEHYEK